jgi:hypothetical protein
MGHTKKIILVICLLVISVSLISKADSFIIYKYDNFDQIENMKLKNYCKVICSKLWEDFEDDKYIIENVTFYFHVSDKRINYITQKQTSDFKPENRDMINFEIKRRIDGKCMIALATYDKVYKMLGYKTEKKYEEVYNEYFRGFLILEKNLERFKENEGSIVDNNIEFDEYNCIFVDSLTTNKVILKVKDSAPNLNYFASPHKVNLLSHGLYRHYNQLFYDEYSENNIEIIGIDIPNNLYNSRNKPKRIYFNKEFKYFDNVYILGGINRYSTTEVALTDSKLDLKEGFLQKTPIYSMKVEYENQKKTIFTTNEMKDTDLVLTERQQLQEITNEKATAKFATRALGLIPICAIFTFALCH